VFVAQVGCVTLAAVGTAGKTGVLSVITEAAGVMQVMSEILLTVSV
jgi:hypothetical protein